MADSAAKWSRLAALSAWQWRVMVLTPVVLLATWLRLRFRGYRAAMAAVRIAPSRKLQGEEALEVARETAFALAAAIKYGPWRPRCLLRSLMLAHFLGRRGIGCEVRIGLPAGQSHSGSGAEPGFSAHAWVEYSGVVLNDADDVATRFIPFESPLGGL